MFKDRIIVLKMKEIHCDTYDLVRSYDDNCRDAESQAMEVVSSVDIPVFNCLRDLTVKKCYIVVNCLDSWFGYKPTIYHCTCLLALTEYISYSYSNRAFYETFAETKQDKHYYGLFLKLCAEWSRMFSQLPLNEFTSVAQFSALLDYLRKSLDRFPQSVSFRWLLEEIKQTGRRCESRFQYESQKSSQSIEFTNSSENMFQKVINDEITDLLSKKDETSKKSNQISLTKFLIPKDKTTKSSSDISVDENILKEENSIKLLPSKKINAFDILMRKFNQKKNIP